MRVLIADDSRTAALFLRTKLEELGYEVVETRTGAEAWKHLQEQPERLVITDWVMPDMDGIDLCRLIRSRGLLPYTYIVLLTTKDSQESRLEAMEAGADSFIPKPVDERELELTLRIARRILQALDAHRNSGLAAAQVQGT